MLNLRAKKVFWYLLSIASCLSFSSCRSTSSRDPSASDIPTDTRGNSQKLLEVPKGQTYLPKFGEYIPINFKIMSKDLTGADVAARMSDIIVNGGSYRNAQCQADNCSIEILYSDSALTPDLSFELSNSSGVGGRGYIVPEKEIFTVLKQEQSIPSGKTLITVSPGIEYISSWNRSLPSINIKSLEGFATPPHFVCNPKNCVAEVDMEIDGTSVINWEAPFTTDSKNAIKLNIKVVKSDLKANKTQAVIDGDGSEVLWTLGNDYTSDSNLVADRVRFLTENSYVTINGEGCDPQGTCRANIKYDGTEEFTLLRYRIESGSAKSEAQTLKITHRVRVTPKPLEVYKDVDEWQLIRLEPGDLGHYIAKDNNFAQTINVIDSHFIEFKDQGDQNNRPNNFSCDTYGVCSAYIKLKNRLLRNVPSIDFSIQTKFGNSPIVSKEITLVEDSFVFNKRDPYISGKEDVDGWEFFKFSTKKNEVNGYRSFASATSIFVPFKEEDIEFGGKAKLIDGIWTAPCDDKGECVIEGRFKSSDEPKGFHITLKNDKFISDSFLVRLSNQQHSLVPRITKSDASPVPLGEDTFTYHIKWNEPLGYDGEYPATALHIKKPSGLIFPNLVKTISAEFEEELEVQCGKDGDCRIDLKASKSNPSFFYYLKKGSTQVSEISYLPFLMPIPFADWQNIVVPEGDIDVPVSLSSQQSGITKAQLLNPGVAPSELTCELSCKGRLKLKNALAAGERLEVPYVYYVGNFKSNVGTIFVRAEEAIRLKPNTLLEATHKESDFFTFSIKSENLNGVSQKIWPSLFAQQIEIEGNSESQLLSTNCDSESMICTYEIRAKFDGKVKILSFRNSEIIAGGLVFAASEFKVKFNKNEQ